MKKRHSTRRQFGVAALALLFGPSAILDACSPIVWAGGKGRWEDAEKWSKRRVPTANDTVVIHGGTVVLPVGGIEQGRDFAEIEACGVYFVGPYA